jgi:cytochrome bd-type quinol oxidase subunit 2
MHRVVKQILSFSLLGSGVFVLFVGCTAYAQVIGGETAQMAQQQLNSATFFDPNGDASVVSDPRLFAAYVVQVALGFLGTGLFILSLIAGYNYLTARGNDDKVRKAKDMLRQAVMGMVLILLAFSLTTFIINGISESFKQGGIYSTFQSKA